MRIASKRVWIADQFLPAVIEIENGVIKNVLPYDGHSVDHDYGNLRIVPGFMDIHCHGAYGFDTNDAHKEGLRSWTRNIPKEGVTSFLATTITQSDDVLLKAVENVAAVMEEGYEGAELLGIHMEGPFLAQSFKGAQPEQYIVSPSVEQFKKFQTAAKGNIRYMTLATENDKNFELTDYCVKNDVVISVGHSAATYEETLMAWAHGASCMTHVFNGMSRFHHRENGLTGAALRLRTMFGEIICDGNHVTPAALNAYFLSKGPDWPIMMSDSVMAKGTPAGSRFLFGGQEIEVYEDGSAHIIETGGLAGSTLRINEGLKILVEDALVPFNYALNSCTINPARCLHLEHRKGSIQTGKDADLVVLNDDYSVHQTYAKGRQCL